MRKLFMMAVCALCGSVATNAQIQTNAGVQ